MSKYILIERTDKYPFVIGDRVEILQNNSVYASNGDIGTIVTIDYGASIVHVDNKPCIGNRVLNHNLKLIS